MFGAKFVAVVVVTLWLSKSNFNFEAYGDAVGDVIPTPTSCENCQVTPPPSGYPSYEAPPPPSQPPPPSSGYSIYGAPPPPSPHKSGQSKCPPAAGVQCCTPPAPYTYGYGYGPPNPYTYVPYGEGQGPASMVLPILVPLIMLFSSIFLV
ncbi:hypothetical protein AAZX31_14G013500 [Glycine max]|uniref:Uncharacterized protein n=1 Tax=Glycine max TaxID=3847 RepID=I1M6G3_SOYBN|nr:leucine-rich repeat extensin-like protein 3 [Glycine max]KAG4961831.1 hypothetical protein JHK86_038699 [Glycine max]KAG5109298.1 hypothetical protein JHK82_038521 [Glycine max]KAH1092629.1 hypothetical protein GYH30_038710 [Glycine max]KRH14227.1 hypothetical protein GLYMA_14G013600v4 [Glycine max]